MTSAEHRAGLTIIELMISILLASMLTAGLFYMMSGQQMTYRTQINRSVLDQNLSATMSYMQRQIRSAGYGIGSCPSFNSAEVGRVHMKSSSGDSDPSPLVAIELFNNCNLITSDPSSGGCPDNNGSDSIKITSVHPGAMVTKNMPSVIMQTKMLSNTDDIQIAHSSLYPQQFTVGDPRGPDLAVLWDPTGGPCIVLEVTAVDSSPPIARLSHADKDPFNGGDWWLPFKTTGYEANATRVTRISADSYPRIFAVDKTTRQLMTWQSLNANPRADLANGTLEVVADQIEDMQASLACDVNANGTLDEGTTSGARRTDEWAHNVPLDTPPACGDRPVGAVRLTLIARSDSETVGGPAVGALPAAEDRPQGPPDRFSRSMMTATVKTFNLRVQ